MPGSTRRSLLLQAATAFAVAVAAGRGWRSAKAAQPEPVEHRVEIRQLSFVPDRLSVRPGDTITWVNRDIVPHTATAADRSWDTGAIGKGQAKSIVVAPGMALDYFCRFHPMMKAALVVDVTD